SSPRTTSTCHPTRAFPASHDSGRWPNERRTECALLSHSTDAGRTGTARTGREGKSKTGRSLHSRLWRAFTATTGHQTAGPFDGAVMTAMAVASSLWSPRQTGSPASAPLGSTEQPSFISPNPWPPIRCPTLRLSSLGASESHLADLRRSMLDFAVAPVGGR